MTTEVNPSIEVNTGYTYAVFDDAGRCISITKTVVALETGHLVPAGTKAGEVWMSSEGEILPTVPVEISLDKEYFLADGMDAVEILGLPEDATVTINGTITWELKREQADTLVIEATGKYRSNQVVAQGAPKDFFVTKFHAQVDDEAANARLAFVTDVPGQTAVYAKKEAEARSILKGEAGTFPFITAEAGQDATAQIKLAQAIVARADACDAAVASIEALRMGAKKIISEATDIDTMLGATQITWPKGEDA